MYTDICRSEFIYANIDAIPLELICSVCALPLVNPVEHPECGNEICESCTVSQADCPSCNKPLVYRAITAKRLLTPLNNLSVHCPTCNVITKRSLLAEHYDNCEIGYTT